MIIVGILAAFCSYKFIFSEKSEQVNAEKEKQADLEKKIADVKKEAGKEPIMKKDIETWQKEIEAMVSGFNVKTRYEDGILYAKSIEDDLGTIVKTYNIGETKTDKTVEGKGSFKGKKYEKGSTNYSFSYTVENYEAMKKLINYVVDDQGGIKTKTLDSMTFSIASNGSISGSIALTVYVMKDGSVDYEPPVIEGVEFGELSNIFHSDELEAK